MKHTAFIGIGSNLGDRISLCQQATQKIAALPKTDLIQQSPLYETEPVVLPHQQKEKEPWFINGVVQIETNFEAKELLKNLQEIEGQMGRLRTDRWAPRIIDLDLLFFDSVVSSAPNLTLPHPEITKRRFVLQPLADIAPDWEHPLVKKLVRTLLKELEDRSQIKVHRSS
ncbi:MAG: 2-amino-4-hydroxy-6-hydroxymethyldihydropteridine diphosphokinase [Deltaproteobacteria bacterium]|nr:2-amino-4-hydroxy-6-hydroxymethyldihydropteridine diphosphokinase [Deltaproteobacteria bacterium]